jgi:hypothetical protein
VGQGIGEVVTFAMGVFGVDLDAKGIPPLISLRME